MTSVVNTNSWQQKKKLQESFQQANPFPHFVLDDFLEETLAQDLFRNFPSFYRGNSLNESGEKGGKAVREDMPKIGPAFAKVDEFFQSRDFLNWMSEITGIPDLLYDASYFGGGTHENLPGQDLGLHIDFNYHPVTGWRRRVNCLLYLNPEWDEQWGGSLELWNDPFTTPSKNVILKVPPAWNRLAVFATSERSWHGFETIQIAKEKLPQVGSRKSIAIYLYTKMDPSPEKRNSHSTVYYAPPMSETIEPEKVISKNDFEEVKRVIGRRDGLLQFLYRREVDFNNHIDGLTWELNRAKNSIHDLYDGQMKLLMQLPVERRKDFLVVSGAEENILETANCLAFYPTIVPLTKILVAPTKKVELGKWVALPDDKFTGLWQLVYVHEDLGDLVLAWCGDRMLLLPKQSFPLAVKGFYDSDKKLLDLPTPKVVVSDKIRRVIFIYRAVHWLKGKIVGRLKSRLLWNLSCAYRDMLSRSGVKVPLIIPSK